MADLARSIGPWRGAGMMLSIVLGAGLITLPGLAAQAVGQAAPLVWLVCAVVALPLLAVFAIVGRLHPDAGGVPSVMHRAFGDGAFVAATFLFLGAVAVGLPSIAITGGHYAAAAFGGPVHLYAAGLLVAAMAANLLSAELSGRLNGAVASVVVVVLVGVAALGWQAVSPDWRVLQVAPAEMPDIALLGAAFMMVFFAFTGWEVASNLGGEVRDPERNIPRAMALSFAVAVALYLVLALVVAAAGPMAAVEAPFAAILGAAHGAAGRAAMSVVALILVFANLSAAIWAVSRMVYAAGRERLLPGAVARVSRGRPLVAVLLTTGCLLAVTGLAAAGLLDLAALLALAGQNFLLLYAGAAAALFVLSEAPSHRGLALSALLLVAALMVARGAEGLVYPGLLIGAGLAVSACRRRLVRAEDEPAHADTAPV